MIIYDLRNAVGKTTRSSPVELEWPSQVRDDEIEHRKFEKYSILCLFQTENIELEIN